MSKLSSLFFNFKAFFCFSTAKLSSVFQLQSFLLCFSTSKLSSVSQLAFFRFLTSKLSSVFLLQSFLLFFYCKAFFCLSTSKLSSLFFNIKAFFYFSTSKLSSLFFNPKVKKKKNSRNILISFLLANGTSLMFLIFIFTTATTNTTIATILMNSCSSYMISPSSILTILSSIFSLKLENSFTNILIFTSFECLPLALLQLAVV